MTNKFKIAIAGIGGVGGYIGGKLATHYKNSATVSVFFIARGENEKAIQENGLKLIMPGTTLTAYPSGVSSKPEALGIMDLIICCTKTYQLKESIKELAACNGKDTLFLPLLNGVDAKDSIKEILPGAMVLDACIYLVARLTSAAVVEQFGNVHQLYFGSDDHPADKLRRIETIFKDAGIDAMLSANVKETCWEKFFFISTIATLTSYLDKTIGEILSNELFKEKLLGLMNEFKQVAKAKGISLPENIIDKTFTKLASLPFDATSSMHTDFKKGNQTELSSVTEYVVSLGKELNVAIPIYSEMLTVLVNKSRK